MGAQTKIQTYTAIDMKTCRLGGLLLLLFCVHTIMYAQQARTVRGRVQMLETGSEKKQPLPSASIVVLEKTDSTFVKGTASDKMVALL